ncbi:MAG: hypothetical protein RRY95_01115 [Oscillospiraceae bacterium]
MQIPELDRRGKEEILNTIASTAAAYTPEWRFDRENPDLGAALALIYTELFTQTIKRYNAVADKNMAAFFDSMDLQLLPALPAEGFVRFGLAGQVEAGEEIHAGTPLLADTEETEDGVTSFETIDDVLVTAAEPTRIFSVCGGADAIVKSYDKDSGGEEPFSLFDWRTGNLQRHALYLGQEAVLELSAGGALTLELTPGHQRELPREVAEALTDPQRTIWEYSDGENWQRFSGCSVQDNRIRLELGRHHPPISTAIQADLEERRWVRLRLCPDAKAPLFALRQLRLSAENRGLLPDLIHAAGSDADIHEFFPFGEQLGLFAESYFGCNEALVKAGAEIELHFNLNFVPIPVEYVAGENPINWKLVMKKQDFVVVDETVDITIQEVAWEYFNGNGWARLFTDSRNRDCFTAARGAMDQIRSIRFPCPEDMAQVLVNSSVGYFVRARVLRIKNLFQRKGNYIAPVIEGLRFSYHYPQRGRLPQAVVTENNCARRSLDAGFFRDAAALLTPFDFLTEDKPTAYFGFPLAPAGGPIRLLFLLAEALREKPGRLRWEYRGERGWESLNVVDETENLRQTGILTWMSGKKFQQATLWGENLYWVRAVDEEGRYFSREAQFPRITRLYMNATRVRNVATCPPERFFIEAHRKHITCRLLHPRVHHAEVWVNELEELLPAELAALEKTEGFRAVRDAAGILREAWVRWEECEDFALSQPRDRQYQLDHNEGVIRFSDGVNGRIPTAGKQETIEVLYAVGGGRVGNVEPTAINRSSRALGFVSLVENPRRTAGGCDQETFVQAVRRGGAALRHGDRAVTASDFEALALDATRNIVRARCFPGRDACGERRPGFVTLVAVLQNYAEGADFFPAVRSQVLDTILHRCGGNLAALEKFSVVQPQFLELCVKVELSVAAFNQVFSVRQEIDRRLATFLHPLEGNFDGRGWEIGRIPNDTQIRNCLSGVGGVTFLKTVSVTAFIEGNAGRIEANLDEPDSHVFALPRNGTHEILITIAAL